MTAGTLLTPRNEQDVVSILQDAAAREYKITIEGNGTKSSMGKPTPSAYRLRLGSLSGILDYDPDELVITAQAGTPVSEIQHALSEREQFLAFDPLDYGQYLAPDKSDATIGGVIASGASGSRRLTQGAVRDHFLGFKAVSGRAEVFQAGGRVVKNVTGYDLPKLMAGSWGRLVALTEVTLRALPQPEKSVTLGLYGVNPHQAQDAVSTILSRALSVAAIAYQPMGKNDTGQLIVRLEGFETAISEGTKSIISNLSKWGTVDVVSETEAKAIWSEIETLGAMSKKSALWRIVTAPSAAPTFVDSLPQEAVWSWDWGGGLTWVGTNATDADIRNLARRVGGHAMLVRGSAEMRLSVPFLQPQIPTLLALEERVRRAFDPQKLFETGRFLEVQT